MLADTLESLQNKKKASVLKILRAKFIKVLQVLFGFGKLQWFETFEIEDPSPDELQYIEDLQKELRKIKAKKIEELSKNEISEFAKRILRV